MTTGEKIRKRRLELNMTMDDLGRAVGVQRSAINKYEKDMIDMKASTLAAIARVLMVSPVYLLDDVEDDDSDQARLEALHQDPRLCLLFDRTRKMSHADVETMLAVSASILKERDSE